MIPGEITVAEGGILDLDAVMSVMDDSFDPSYGEAWTAPQCAGLMPMPGVWLSLAREGQDVVGFSLARVVSDEAELLLLAVSRGGQRSEDQTSELQSLMRLSYSGFCLNKKTTLLLLFIVFYL